MIDVAVGVYQLRYGKVVVGNEFFQLIFFLLIGATRINNDTSTCFIVKHVGVFLKGVEFKMFYLQHCQTFDLKIKPETVRLVIYTP